MNSYSSSSVVLDPVVMDNNMYFDDFDRHIFDDDDDEVLRSHRGRSDLRAHLDDLARRHPEFADHLRSPPGWVSDFQPGSGSSRFSSSSGGDTGDGGAYFHQAESSNSSDRPDQPRHQDASQQQPTGNFQEHKAGGSSTLGRDHLSQHGLRNTDPEIGLKGQAAAKEDRNQRSMSAPPDGRSQLNSSDKPQRFVSKIEINPVNPATGETASSSNMNDSGAGKPPMAPPKSQQSPQQQSQQHKQSNVRHIPIFVEGRDEPVLSRNVDQDIPTASSKQNFQSQPPTNQQQQFHQQQYHHPQQTPPQRKTQQPPQTHYEQPKAQEQKSHENVQPSQPTTEKKQKVYNNDPIFQVEQIQKEVDELRKKIDEFSGSSRSDKDYMFLDEMLTRNLIKLDNIETEGKENVRAVRKEAIRSIQQNISALEAKVPQTPTTINPSPSSTSIDIDDNCKMAGNFENSTGKQSESDTGIHKMETNQSENNNTGENIDGKQIPMDQSESSQQKDAPADSADSVAKSTVADQNQTNPTEVKC